MQVSFGSDEPVERIAAGEINHLFQPDGIAFFTRRIAVIGKRGHVDHIVLFSDTEAALALPGEKPTEARLDAYAAQARKPYNTPTLTEYTLPETDGEVDLAAEANPPQFQIGDRVTPIQSKMYIGVIATVEEVSPEGDYLRFEEWGRWFPASLFRLADPEPLAEANPPMELPF